MFGRSCFRRIVFGFSELFWHEISFGRVAIAHRGPTFSHVRRTPAGPIAEATRCRVTRKGELIADFGGALSEYVIYVSQLRQRIKTATL